MASPSSTASRNLLASRERSSWGRGFGFGSGLGFGLGLAGGARLPALELAVEVRLEPPLLVRCVGRREGVLPEVHGRGPGEDADADDEEERAESMSHGSITE